MCARKQSIEECVYLLGLTHRLFVRSSSSHLLSVCSRLSKCPSVFPSSLLQHLIAKLGNKCPNVHVAKCLVLCRFCNTRSTKNIFVPKLIFFLSSSSPEHDGGRILQSVIIITAVFISVTAKFGAWCLPFKLSAAILTHLNQNSLFWCHHPQSFIPPASSVIIFILISH